MKKLNLLILFSFILLAFSCKKDTELVPEDKNDITKTKNVIVPLKNGGMYDRNHFVSSFEQVINFGSLRDAHLISFKHSGKEGNPTSSKSSNLLYGNTNLVLDYVHSTKDGAIVSSTAKNEYGGVTVYTYSFNSDGYISKVTSKDGYTDKEYTLKYNQDGKVEEIVEGTEVYKYTYSGEDYSIKETSKGKISVEVKFSGEKVVYAKMIGLGDSESREFKYNSNGELTEYHLTQFDPSRTFLDETYSYTKSGNKVSISFKDGLNSRDSWKKVLENGLLKTEEVYNAKNSHKKHYANKKVVKVELFKGLTVKDVSLIGYKELTYTGNGLLDSSTFFSRKGDKLYTKNIGFFYHSTKSNKLLDEKQLPAADKWIAVLDHI
ncbi:hypothetical protein [Flammeovirga kamogawensis]|uniref:RHS repeat protein n=1 Tax=Flammeovirga kamogawensis TaxID=373891 RepID=A0ABX8GUD6_9BACT|nr:hypothetical protein [Flammeovirga kamogawensis]MBB6459726.1 hypothetical protein [Flammeovirga kamogawensis]QWG07215.1 hypothetical protein KM029_18215 [Flammeovirga kamogawensis]TRX69035.1 hypothetical protein EO216_13205 [Flammeovirga kamogawensis]